MNECSQCNAPIEPNSLFCGVCGMKQAGAKADSAIVPPSTAPKKSSVAKTMMVSPKPIVPAEPSKRTARSKNPSVAKTLMAGSGMGQQTSTVNVRSKNPSVANTLIAGPEVVLPADPSTLGERSNIPSGTNNTMPSPEAASSTGKEVRSKNPSLAKTLMAGRKDTLSVSSSKRTVRAKKVDVVRNKVEGSGSEIPPVSSSLSPQESRFSGEDSYVGQVLNDRFVIHEKLGEGGFGAVYKGVQKGTNRVVALKLLHPEMTRDQNVVDRFRLEGQVLCSLQDAHSITTYDFAQTSDGTLFIAMELLEGRSLHDVFQDEPPVQWRRMLKILSEMCTSLDEAHSKGIVHRDLKPENVHLEKRAGNDEFVKILDFGIAKMITGDGIGFKGPQLTATGQTLGTLEYMSPEQLMGKDLDGRSDIYGMGVLAYELMTGQLPFPNAVGPALLISAQLKQIPPVPSAVNPHGEIPSSVDALILKMLEKNRDNRFKDVVELRTACLDILGLGSGSQVARLPSKDSLQDSGNRDFGQAREESFVPPSPVIAEVTVEPGPSTEAILKATQGTPVFVWAFVFLAIGGAGVAAYYFLG